MTKTEGKFSAKVLEFFRTKLAEVSLDDRIQVEEKVKILKDLTVGKDRDDRWRLIAGFQQQDIVFFSPADSISMADFQSEIMRIDKYDRIGLEK